MPKKTATAHPIRELTYRQFLITSLVSCVLFFGCSFFTSLRLWGVAPWGYLPLWGKLVLPIAGASAVFALMKFGSELEATLQKPFPILAIILAIPATLSFWLFRGQTHFLGDGYTNLAALSADHPIIKGREIGESMLHLWLAQALGGSDRSNVLLSYQIISVATGILLIGLVLWSAFKIFERVADRLIFTVALTTAGEALLFFGYVENYSLFALSIGAFTCIGILVATGKLKRALIFVPLAFAVIFHIFGVTLIPAALYLYISGTAREKRIDRLSFGAKFLWVMFLAVVGSGTLWVAVSHSLFLRISLLSFATTQFTISGYTLFSGAHLLDFANLLFLLVPGLLIGVFGLWNGLRIGLFKLPAYRFLTLLVLSTLGAAFIFDPKLGMPRDWDLYSFPAIPLAALLIMFLLEPRANGRWGRIAALAVIAIGAVTLCARAVTQSVPTAALQQIGDYTRLDPVKSKNALVYIQEYYREIGDTIRVAELQKQYESLPDELLYRQINFQASRGNSAQVITLAQQAARYNPMSTQAYAYIASACLQVGRVDEAIDALNIALALNPHNADALTGLGFIKFHQNDPDGAEKLYREAMQYGPQKSAPFFYMAGLCRQRHQPEQQLVYLKQAVSKDDATGEMFANLGDLYLSSNQVENAAAIYKAGLGHGIDTNLVNDRLARSPQLRALFAPPQPHP
jgi:Tfp pilus assembly protein PilF